MPQSVFQDQLKDVDGILQDSNILGLYESNIDPVSRAIIDLGNTVKFDDTRVGALGKGLKNGFNTKELLKVESDTYLRKFDMDMVYLLHIVTNSYEFFTVFKTWENDCQMFVLKPSAAAQELPSNIHRIYREIYETKKDKLEKVSNIVKYPEDMAFEVNYYHDASKLFKKLNQSIGKIHEMRNTKALFAVQSPYTERILSLLPTSNDFPTVKMNIRELSLPAVGWQTLISKRVINHFLYWPPGLRIWLPLLNTQKCHFVIYKLKIWDS